MSSPQDYALAISREDQIRAQMYQPGMESDPMNTNPHHHLLPLLENWDQFRVQHEDRSDLLFSYVKPTPRSVKEVADSLRELKPFFAIPNLFVAGGRIFSALFEAKSNDIDFFMWGISPEEAEQKIIQIADLFRSIFVSKTGDEIQTLIKLTRTRNAISFRVQTYCEIRHKKKVLSTQDYQVILRLYQSPSEILHGFDVDSCCLGYDGKEVWATERAYFALTHGYNTVNFDRLSPSYESRLIKYATRGMAIVVPNFNRS